MSKKWSQNYLNFNLLTYKYFAMQFFLKTIAFVFVWLWTNFTSIKQDYAKIFNENFLLFSQREKLQRIFQYQKWTPSISTMSTTTNNTNADNIRQAHEYLCVGYFSVVDCSLSEERRDADGNAQTEPFVAENCWHLYCQSCGLKYHGKCVICKRNRLVVVSRFAANRLPQKYHFLFDDVGKMRKELQIVIDFQR